MKTGGGGISEGQILAQKRPELFVSQIAWRACPGPGVGIKGGRGSPGTCLPEVRVLSESEGTDFIWSICEG